MLADAALNAWQRIREPGEPARFAQFAHALPLRMITVLQAAGRITADRLDVGAWIGGVQDVPVGRRDSERGKASFVGGAQGFAIRSEIAEAAAVPLPADREFGRADVFQPDLFEALCRGG